MVKTSRKYEIKVPAVRYSEAFKRKVVAEYESGILNKDQIQRKYGVGGNSQILDWCRKYGKLPYAAPRTMPGRPMKDPQKQRIKELERKLQQAELKISLYQKLIEVTEREEGIQIIKKDGAKQSGSTDKSTLK